MTSILFLNMWINFSGKAEKEILKIYVKQKQVKHECFQCLYNSDTPSPLNKE